MPDEPVSSFRAYAARRGDSVVVVAEGELDLVGAPRLIEALPAGGDEPVVVDLGSVAFMDSSGLRALLEARRSCVDAGRRFALARPSGPVWRVLELVDLTGEFEIVEAPS
jgi:anti-sigma B factor antagonist